MTELLYMTDAYLREADAQIVAVTDDGVVLDRTPFYPTGGGQPSDFGVLAPKGSSGDGVPVSGVKRVEGKVVHFVEPEKLSALEVGTSVRASIDWERRHQLMRTHTSLHILCGVIWRDYSAPVTGGNMEPLKGRLDFELDSMSKEFSEEIEAKVNAEIAADREIVVRILPREEAFQIPDLIRTKINLLPPAITEVRTVDIVGLDYQADGGTHVASTKEVGSIRVTQAKSKGKGNKRIAIAIED